jgi:hypothetical protein
MHAVMLIPILESYQDSVKCVHFCPPDVVVVARDFKIYIIKKNYERKRSTGMTERKQESKKI